MTIFLFLKAGFFHFFTKHFSAKINKIKHLYTILIKFLLNLYIFLSFKTCQILPFSFKVCGVLNEQGTL